MAQAEYYDHMTLPGKNPVYFRDSKLNEGREFSIVGDVTAAAVRFDGTGNVSLEADLTDGSVTLDHLANTTKTNEVNPDDPRMVSSGAVYDTLDGTLPEPIPDADIIDVVDNVHPDEPQETIDFDNINAGG